MIINVKSFCIVLVFAMLAPFQVVADEVKDTVNDVAAKLVKQLPMDKKIALKSLSPDETGLPKEFLRKLVSDLEASLLTASNFEIKLINRNTTEEIWSDAIEFGDTKFDELYEASEASILLILSPRISPVGLEISASAYELKGISSGTLISSSGNLTIDVDVKKLLGINVATINEEISEIRKKLLEMSQTLGLINKPTKFLEYVHNSRINTGNANYYGAILDLEQALAIDSKYLDLAEQLGHLILLQFGQGNALQFIEKRLFFLPKDIYIIVQLSAAADPDKLLEKYIKPTFFSEPLEPLRHVVQRGETTFSIARLYGVSRRSLASLNGLEDYISREGMQLIIPKKDTSPAIPAIKVDFTAAFWAIWIPRFLPSPYDLVFADTTKKWCKSGIDIIVKKAPELEESYITGMLKNEFLDVQKGLFSADKAINIFRTIRNNPYLQSDNVPGVEQTC